jgi:hypothetical protein
MADTKSESVSSANYIIQFFNDVENLSWQSANYLNLMIELKAKNPDMKEFEGLSDQEQQSLVNITQQLRAMAFRCFVKYQALKESVTGMEDKNIQPAYKKVIEGIVPLQKDIEDFNIKMNTIFVKGIMADFLMKSNDIIAGLTA